MAETRNLPHLPAQFPFDGLFRSIIASFRNLRERLHKNAMYRESVAELEALSFRDLEDLGIARWQIEDIAHESVYGAK